MGRGRNRRRQRDEPVRAHIAPLADSATVEQRIQSARQALVAAQLAFVEFANEDSDIQRKEAAFANFVMNARRVTFMLERLKSAIPGFDAWYAAEVAAHLSKELAVYFNGLRVAIEHHESPKLCWMAPFTTPSAEVFSGEVLFDFPTGEGHRANTAPVPYAIGHDGSRIPMTTTAYMSVSDHEPPGDLRPTDIRNLSWDYLQVLQGIYRRCVSRYAPEGPSASSPS